MSGALWGPPPNLDDVLNLNLLLRRPLMPTHLAPLTNTLGKSPNWALPSGNCVKGAGRMRTGLRRAPQWLQELMQEFSKPPYFLNPPKPGQNQRPTPTSTRDYTYQESGISEDMDALRSRTERKDPRVASRDQGRNLKPRTGRSQGTSGKPNLTAASKPNRAPAQTQTQTNKPRQAIDEQTRAWQAVFRQADYPVSLPALYGWKVINAHQVLGILRVAAEDGEYALKRTHLPPERVVFLHKVLTEVAKNDFTRFAPFILSEKDRPYVYLNGETYYATRWVPGTPANFSSINQVAQTALSLAQFHEASQHVSPGGYQPPSEFHLARMLKERASDLRELIAMAEQARNPDSFDTLLAQLGPTLKKDAERSLRLMETEPCQDFLAEAEQQRGVCHLDVIPDNFIYDHNRLVWLLDFDLATYAPRVLDLYHLLRRSLQRTNWDTEVAYTCFLNFNTVKAIRHEEYLILQALLTFPYQAWRIAQTRYHVFRDPNQVQDLDTYAVQETRRQAFLTAYEGQITSLEAAE